MPAYSLIAVKPCNLLPDFFELIKVSRKKNEAFFIAFGDVVRNYFVGNSE